MPELSRSRWHSVSRTSWTTSQSSVAAAQNDVTTNSVVGIEKPLNNVPHFPLVVFGSTITGNKAGKRSEKPVRRKIQVSNGKRIALPAHTRNRRRLRQYSSST